MSLGMIDVDLGPFVERGRFGQRGGPIDAAVARSEAQQLDAANDALLRSTRMLDPPRVDELLQDLFHECPRAVQQKKPTCQADYHCSGGLAQTYPAPTGSSGGGSTRYPVDG